jgi:hypothetical protein
MVVTKKHLSRRTLLRGIGTCVALPMLDAMMPAFAAPSRAANGEKAVRAAFIYVPNGMTMRDWTPAGIGPDYEMTPILKAFEPHRQDMFVLSGMMDHNGNALGDGGGDHARAGGSFLTGVHPTKTSGKDIHTGISADQVAANAIGGKTKLPSLELGCEDSRTVGNCDSGYSCAYSNSLSWRGPRRRIRRRRIRGPYLSGFSATTTSRSRPTCGPSDWRTGRAFSILCRTRCTPFSEPWADRTGARWTNI